MSTPENTKLCDFTSTNNNDFICTPIAPPASKADFYEIKPLYSSAASDVYKRQGAGGSIGVQIKSLLLVLVKSHNLVFLAEVPILTELKLSNKNKKL